MSRPFTQCPPEKALKDFWSQFPGTAASAHRGELSPAEAEEHYQNLHPAEQTIIKQAVESRRLEFATTRQLAHTALAELHHDTGSIGKDPAGAPLWPAGATGSLTHCAGFRAAVASTTLTSVGIDAEPARPLPSGVVDSIASAAERAQFAQLALPLDTVLFSAKEALYKTWYTVMGTWLGFLDAQITLTVRHASSAGQSICAVGSFSATVQEDTLCHPDTNPRYADAFRELSGQWLIHSGLIVTSCHIP